MPSPLTPPRRQTAPKDPVPQTKATQCRLDVFLKQTYTDYSREKLKQLILEGFVKVNGEVQCVPRTMITLDFEDKKGDDVQITFPPPSSEFRVSPQIGDLEVLFQDDDIIVIDKPMGLTTHRGSGMSEEDETLVARVLAKAGVLATEAGAVRPGTVHRLDKGTTGVMVFAKTARAYYGLIPQFEKHTIERAYQALCWGWLTDDLTIEATIGPDPKDYRRRALRDSGDYSRTDITPLRVWGDAFCSLVECHLFTGRTHQIRLHLQSKNHPIVGDKVYGKDELFLKKSVLSPEARTIIQSCEYPLLHAFRLGLTHPVSGKPLLFESPLPALFQSLVVALDKSSVLE